MNLSQLRVFADTFVSGLRLEVRLTNEEAHEILREVTNGRIRAERGGRSLGIIPELEMECLPRPGELVVMNINTITGHIGLSETLGGEVVREGHHSEFSHRYNPMRPAPAVPCLGDIMRPKHAPYCKREET